MAGLAASLLLAACGSGARQDVNEHSGRFPVDVAAAKFPTSQRLAQQSKLVISVRNAGTRTIPNVAVTICNTTCAYPAPAGQGTSVAAFAQYLNQPGLANHSRPIWVIDRPPGACGYSCASGAAGSAFTSDANTWALGPLKAGDGDVQLGCYRGCSRRPHSRLAGCRGSLRQGPRDPSRRHHSPRIVRRQDRKAARTELRQRRRQGRSREVGGRGASRGGARRGAVAGRGASRGGRRAGRVAGRSPGWAPRGAVAGRGASPGGGSGGARRGAVAGRGALRGGGSPYTGYQGRAMPSPDAAQRYIDAPASRSASRLAAQSGATLHACSASGSASRLAAQSGATLHACSASGSASRLAAQSGATLHRRPRHRSASRLAAQSGATLHACRRVDPRNVVVARGATTLRARPRAGST